ALHRDRPADPVLVSADSGAARTGARRGPMAWIGGVLLAVVVLASVLAPALAASDPLKPSFGRRLAAPWGLGGTRAHVLGTDNLGRDILARLLHGGRASLALAASAAGLPGRVGLPARPLPG